MHGETVKFNSDIAKKITCYLLGYFMNNSWQIYYELIWRYACSVRRIVSGVRGGMNINRQLKGMKVTLVT